MSRDSEDGAYLGDRPDSRGLFKYDPARDSEDSVVDGKLVRCSVSQMQTFSAEHGGCPRKWWYRYVAKLPKEHDSPAILYGKEAHKLLEDYWKGDRTGRIPDAVADVVRLLGTQHQGAAELELKALTLAGIPFKGSIDYALGPYIYDYKFQGKYRSLPFGPQAVGYLEERRLTHPDIKLHAFSYIHVLNSAPFTARFSKEPLTLTPEQIQAKWLEYEPLMEEMKLAASQKENEVWCNTKACNAYGRQCPYFSTCNKGASPIKEVVNMSFLNELLAAKSTANTDTETYRALPPDSPPPDLVPEPVATAPSTRKKATAKATLKAIRVGLKIGMPEYSSVEASVEVEGTDEEAMAEEAKAALMRRLEALIPAYLQALEIKKAKA